MWMENKTSKAPICFFFYSSTGLYKITKRKQTLTLILFRRSNSDCLTFSAAWAKKNNTENRQSYVFVGVFFFGLRKYCTLAFFFLMKLAIRNLGVVLVILLFTLRVRAIFYFFDLLSDKFPNLEI